MNNYHIYSHAVEAGFYSDDGRVVGCVVLIKFQYSFVMLSNFSTVSQFYDSDPSFFNFTYIGGPAYSIIGYNCS